MVFFVLLEDALEEYKYHCLARGYTKKTMINKHQEYKQLKEYLITKRSITELENVTHHDLKAYVRQKQIAGLQPQSIISMSKQVIAFFNWAVKEGYLEENPMDKVTLPKVPKKMLQGFTPEEVRRMIDVWSNKDYLEVRNKAIIAMMADCGLRAMEIRGLLSKNVKETSLLVYGKGNKDRMVFISPQLKKILIKYERLKKEYFYERDMKDDNYFLSYKGESMSHVAVHNLVKEASRRAGVKDAHPHKFRHFYSVQSITGNNALDIYSLSQLLGHSDISTTQQYLRSLNTEQLMDKATLSSPLMNMGKKGGK